RRGGASPTACPRPPPRWRLSGPGVARGPAPWPRASAARGRGAPGPRPLPGAVPLSHAALGPAGPRPPLVLLHGLFGSRGSLQTVANALARRSGSQVLTLDARNHGGSPHSPVMTYEAMSLDVQQLLARLGIPKCIVLGHSMGGKTAMALALQRVKFITAVLNFLPPP
uniref:sn-1-specific diacylglycerol lipase ABHD11 n=1 Tax=Cairina moschata TaxID=8855 RepID=A0A8C3C6A7_CAIMO